MKKKYFIIKTITFDRATNNPLTVDIALYSSLDRAKMDFRNILEFRIDYFKKLRQHHKFENIEEMSVVDSFKVRVDDDKSFGSDVVFEYDKESNEFIYFKQGSKFLTKIEEVGEEFFK